MELAGGMHLTVANQAAAYHTPTVRSIFGASLSEPHTVLTHPCDIPPLAKARSMMLCIYTSYRYISASEAHQLHPTTLTCQPTSLMPRPYT